MIVFPALDIQDGKAVRLVRGRKEQTTVFSLQPLEMARRWRADGASWLHIVDLDGAFSGSLANAGIISAICNELDMSIQIGGGIRNCESAAKYLDAGAARLIAGTAALENSFEFEKMCSLFPGKIGVSLDAESGILKTRGWVKSSGIRAAEILKQLVEQGAAFAVYTDIERDGTHSGININGLKEILEISAVPVIAAGGISTIEDIRNICQNFSAYKNLEGIITGRALYEKTLSLPEALKIAEGY